MNSVAFQQGYMDKLAEVFNPRMQQAMFVPPVYAVPYRSLMMPPPFNPWASLLLYGLSRLSGVTPPTDAYKKWTPAIPGLTPQDYQVMRSNWDDYQQAMASMGGQYAKQLGRSVDSLSNLLGFGNVFNKPEGS